MTSSTRPARLLDLTRSLRRAGRVATGVDRVEIAYLNHLLADPVPVFGLARTAYGYVLLDRAGLADIAGRLAGGANWGASDLLSRLPRRRSRVVAQVETYFRRRAIARCLPQRLAKMLMNQLPPGTRYINVGHANLTGRVFSALRMSKARIAVLIHDVIPLDHPNFQHPGTVQNFEKKLRRVRAYADLIIYNSNDTKARAEAHFASWGEVPRGVVAHLGVDVPVPDKGSLPEGLPPDPPYFVCVGTIEPRKNHAFLLDLWEEMGPDAPSLLICGSRGWHNDDVFKRLDALSAESKIKELGGLSDGDLAALVQGAAGMLFPSHAEGFGLPPAEAAALRTRILCNELPALREFLGDNAVYASLSDRYLWINTIKRWAWNPSAECKPKKYTPPSWPDHFKTVLRLI